MEWPDEIPADRVKHGKIKAYLEVDEDPARIVVGIGDDDQRMSFTLNKEILFDMVEQIKMRGW